MIRVGFLGTGLIAGNHARQLRAAPGAEIVACHDLDASRSEAFAETYGGTSLNSAYEVIERSDAIYVCTWTAAHPDLVYEVIAAGKPVFCEKPLAVDLVTAQAMAEAVNEAGVVNQVGLVLRHSPAFRWLHSQAQDPAHGSTMSLVFRDDQYLPTQGLYRSTWRADPSLAGAGTLIEHSVHDLDLIRWILGPLESVTCHTAFHHGIDGIEDQATVTLKARSGAHAVLVSVWHDVLSRPSQRRVELFRSGGVFGLEGDWSGPVTWERSDGDKGSLEGPALGVEVQATDGRGQNPDADFIASVTSGLSAYPTFSDALEAHRIVDAAYRSAALDGQPVGL